MSGSNLCTETLAVAVRLPAMARKPTHGQWCRRLLIGLRYCVEVPALENNGSTGGSSIELAARSAI